MVAGFVPGALAYVSKLLIDSVVVGAKTHLATDEQQVWTFVAIAWILLEKRSWPAGVCTMDQSRPAVKSLLTA